jgi:hypothetical protein
MTLDEEGIGHLRAQLINDGLPAHYVDRLVRELEDHLSDLAAESHRSPVDERESRIGCVDELHEVALQQYRLRCFAGRHPALYFALLPVPLTFIVTAAFNILGFAAAVLLVPTLRAHWDWAVGPEFVRIALQSRALWLVCLLGRWIPLFLVAYWVIGASQTSGAGRRWQRLATYALTLLGLWDLVAYGLFTGSAVSETAFDLRVALSSNSALLIFCLSQAASPWIAWALLRLRQGTSQVSCE